MSITTSRRLAEATSCWLHYEYLCQRAGVFDEAALKGVVGQVLSSFIIDKPSRAWSNFKHPVLAQHSKTGRKAEIDFVLAELNGNNMGKIRIAVEAKWADSTHCSQNNIIYDIFRLALLDKFLKENQTPAECIFLLAGTKQTIKDMISKPPFTGKRKLKLQQGVSSRISGDVLNSKKLGEWAKIFDKTATKAAKEAVIKYGFPKITTSFSPGLPSIDLLNTTAASASDNSVKFYAMAWSVGGS